jgi:hypothetical protein
MGAKRLASIFILVTGLLSLIMSSAAAQEKDVADSIPIFFSAGCADCWPYTEEVLLPTLQAKGLTAVPEIQDYTAPGGRTLLLDGADSIERPRSIADLPFAMLLEVSRK